MRDLNAPTSSAGWMSGLTAGTVLLARETRPVADAEVRADTPASMPS
ncbi:hypothetical protein [Streptomyces sp. BH104]